MLKTLDTTKPTIVPPRNVVASMDKCMTNHNLRTEKEQPKPVPAVRNARRDARIPLQNNLISRLRRRVPRKYFLS